MCFGFHRLPNPFQGTESERVVVQGGYGYLVPQTVQRSFDHRSDPGIIVLVGSFLQYIFRRKYVDGPFADLYFTVCTVRGEFRDRDQGTGTQVAAGDRNRIKIVILVTDLSHHDAD